jgi:hypothetical protein
MNKQKIFLLSAVLLFASLTSGCWLWPFGGGTPAPQSGFKVRGEMWVQAFGGGYSFVSSTSVRGNWQFDNGSALGNTTTFSSCCGTIPVADGRVPARWQIFAGPPGCGQLTNPNMDVSAGQTKVAQCLTFGILFPFAMSPGSINLQAPPATMDMTGSGLTTTYGLPRIEYMDQYTGDMIAVTTATSVTGDGNGLQATTPNLSFVYSGTFSVFVSNAQADGSFEYVGATTVDAYGRDFVFEEPPPPGGCGCPPDGPCMVCQPEN